MQESSLGIITPLMKMMPFFTLVARYRNPNQTDCNQNRGKGKRERILLPHLTVQLGLDFKSSFQELLALNSTPLICLYFHSGLPTLWPPAASEAFPDCFPTVSAGGKKRCSILGPQLAKCLECAGMWHSNWPELGH